MENKIRRSPDNSIRPTASLIPIIMFLGFLASGCVPAQSTLSPEEQALWARYSADQKAAKTINAADRATFEAKYPVHTPTPTPYKEKKITPMKCAQVKENGSVYQALADANGGILPGEVDLDGDPTYVQLDHKDPTTLANVRSLMTLVQALKQNPIVSEGDQACFSSDQYRLNTLPTPTPGPYIKPQSMHHNNTATRSFAVMNNRQSQYFRKG